MAYITMAWEINGLARWDAVQINCYEWKTISKSEVCQGLRPEAL